MPPSLPSPSFHRGTLLAAAALSFLPPCSPLKGPFCCCRALCPAATALSILHPIATRCAHMHTVHARPHRTAGTPPSHGPPPSCTPAVCSPCPCCLLAMPHALASPRTTSTLPMSPVTPLPPSLACPPHLCRRPRPHRAPWRAVAVCPTHPGHASHAPTLRPSWSQGECTPSRLAEEAICECNAAAIVESSARARVRVAHLVVEHAQVCRCPRDGHALRGVDHRRARRAWCAAARAARTRRGGAAAARPWHSARRSSAHA